MPSITVEVGRHSDAAGATVHRAGLHRPDDVVFSRRIERTSSARTIIDVAREDGVDDAVVIADAALHRRLTDRAQLTRTFERCRRWPGSRPAAEAIERSDHRAESPLESVSRLRIADARLPRPELQTQILDLRGRWRTRCDFYWPDFGVVGEADGMLKYDDTAGHSLRDEKRRQERLEQAGLIVVRWGWDDLADLAGWAARITWALERGSTVPVLDRRWTELVRA